MVAHDAPCAGDDSILLPMKVCVIIAHGDDRLRCMLLRHMQHWLVRQRKEKRPHRAALKHPGLTSKHCVCAVCSPDHQRGPLLGRHQHTWKQAQQLVCDRVHHIVAVG